MAKNLRFDSLVAKGENPNGMVAQTADETVRNAEALPPQNYGYNQQADGARWNCTDANHFKRGEQSFPPAKTR